MLLSDLKTGERIPYKDTGWELVEWECPVCKHRWWEYSCALDYPYQCPMCGSFLADEEER